MDEPVPLKVFFSHGDPYTDKQRKFVEAFQQFLIRNGCHPHTLGQNVHRAKQPVLAARKEIQASHGAIVLAFERYEIEKGDEYPRTKGKKSIAGMKLPTIWNQLEGGMAYGLDIPLLILTEKGLKRQGILSDRTEWFPQEIELLPAILKDKKFNGVFDDWKRLASERLQGKKQTAKKLVAGMSMLELVQAIGVHAGITIIATLGSLLASAFGVGFWIGQKFG